MAESSNVGGRKQVQPGPADLAKRYGGRSVCLTAVEIKKIAKVLEDGNFRDVAAAAVGKHESQLARWLVKGARLRKEHPWRQLYDAVIAAEAKAEMASVKQIREAAKKNPKHAQWWLTRKRPEK